MIKNSIYAALPDSAQLRCTFSTPTRQQEPDITTHLELSLHAIVQFHTAALNYLVESADIVSEYSIGLSVARSLRFVVYLMMRSLLSRLGG
jgi:hypothetical protein